MRELTSAQINETPLALYRSSRNISVNSERKWNHERKKLLIEARLKHDPDFIAKKEEIHFVNR